MTFIQRHKILIADLSLVLASIFWGVTFHTVKVGLQEMDAIAMVFYRFSLATLILGVVLFFQKRNAKKSLVQGWFLGGLLWLIYVPQTVGLKYTTASNSGFITGLFVAFVPIFSIVFFKKMPKAIRLFSALLAIIGLWLLTGGFAGLNQGDGITLLSAVACALYILFVDKYVKGDTDPFVLCFHQFYTVAFLSLIWIIFSERTLQVASLSGYVVIVFLGLFATLYAFVVLNVVQRFTAPMKVTLIACLEPVFAALIAWTIGGEAVTIEKLIGGGLIVSAMIISEIPMDHFKPNGEPE